MSLPSTSEPNLDNYRSLIGLGLACLAAFYAVIGITLMPEAGAYKTVWYVLVALPGLLILILDYPNVSAMFSGRGRSLVIVLAIFLLYACVSVFWSDTERGFEHYLKLVLYVALLAVVFTRLYQVPEHVQRLFVAALSVVVFVFALRAFDIVVLQDAAFPHRWTGGGAIRHMLWASHVIGFYTVACLGLLIFGQKPATLTVLLAVLLLGLLAMLIVNGSRTPWVAMAGAIGYWMLVVRSKKMLMVVLAGVVVFAILFALFHEMLLVRGLSVRPEIWSNILGQVKDAWVFGHGIEAAYEPFYVVDLYVIDPHSMYFAVLYEFGAVGLLAWFAVLCTALYLLIRAEQTPGILLAGGLLVFGMVAGLTEGASFLGRPKEQWYILWLPLAIVIAALSVSRPIGQASEGEASRS